MKKPEYGTCRDCGRKIRLSMKRCADGSRTLYAHVVTLRPGEIVYCTGSWTICKEDQRKERAS